MRVLDYASWAELSGKSLTFVRIRFSLGTMTSKNLVDYIPKNWKAVVLFVFLGLIAWAVIVQKRSVDVTLTGIHFHEPRSSETSEVSKETPKPESGRAPKQPLADDGPTLKERLEIQVIKKRDPTEVIINNAPNGIAISGGNVGSATVNNYSAKPLPDLTEEQQARILSRFQGIENRLISIDLNQPTTPDMQTFANSLGSVLSKRFRIVRTEALLLGGCRANPPGVSFMVGVNRVNEARLLWEALVELGVQSGAMPFCSRDGEPDELHVRIFKP